ncbi:metallophosphoesterase [Candidatus Pacearchaeota archaeon]|nr:metallophosphoesterase [Candidatus Pacearchaeota archaeon]
MNQELLQVIKDRGLLLEKEIFDLVSSIDAGVAKAFLESVERLSGQKVITKSVLSKNYEYVQSFVRDLPGNDKNILENTFIKFGLSLEIRKENSVVPKAPETRSQNYRIFYADTKPDKKIEVGDFTGHFRSRYQQLQKILMRRPELTNLISINKISSERQSLSIIAMVSEKRVTKNKNLIIVFEDLTGKVSTLVKADRADVFEKADELQLDDVVGIRASGSRDMLFIQDIFFPDALIPEKTKFDEDISVAFLSDIHCGSDRHLGKSFTQFIDWVESDHEVAKKLRYIFFVGDNVDGVGIFPGQESVLSLKSMKEQYTLLASYLSRVPKHITMFMCPGQHDAARVAEPQPLIDKRYAGPLYAIENLVLVTNPALIKLLEKDKEFKVLMYHGASIHTFINEIKELREMKAHRTPAKAVRHMLKRRHLAPPHSSVVYIPNIEYDPLVISEVPDVLCTGEVHRMDIENYNGVLIITGSCWQSQTPFEEKIGNIPDPCKVAVLNLKSRELKLLDFGIEEELNREY